MFSHFTWLHFLFISIGASIGACSRYICTEFFNQFHLPFSLGTLIVNATGGLLVGALYAYFYNQSHLSPVWRLALITGLCGGFTTFSAFSFEVFEFLQAQKYFFALALSLAHFLSALLLTAIGWYLVIKSSH